MTRPEENGMIINEMNKRVKSKPTGTYEEMVTFQLGTIATMLTDISKSLAIIADKAEYDDAGLMQALKDISDDCNDHIDCIGCKFFDGYQCKISGGIPENWTFKKVEEKNEENE